MHNQLVAYSNSWIYSSFVVVSLVQTKNIFDVVTWTLDLLLVWIYQLFHLLLKIYNINMPFIKVNMIMCLIRLVLVMSIMSVSRSYNIRDCICDCSDPNLGNWAFLKNKLKLKLNFFIL